jgi:hypothetical protein
MKLNSLSGSKTLSELWITTAKKMELWNDKKKL